MGAIKQAILTRAKSTDWYKNLPPLIKEVVEQYPPGIYILKPFGLRCFLIGYNNPESNLISEVTLIVRPIVDNMDFAKIPNVEGVPLCDVEFDEMEEDPDKIQMQWIQRN